jgi:N-acetylneuraminic acid mutarotase
VLLFGGGQAEGSDQIVQVQPGRAHQVAHLPQPLSDLASASVDGTTYLVGGWNGATPSTAVYRFRGDGDPTQVGRLPLGVRYPGAAAVAGRIVVAGGEDSTGNATREVSVFDPRSGRSRQVAALPAPVDHAAGVALAGRFYLVGGLRRGSPSDSVLSWTPGERRFVRAGRLPVPLADAAAVPFAGGIAVIGGRGPSGAADSVLLLRPR